MLLYTNNCILHGAGDLMCAAQLQHCICIAYFQARRLNAPQFVDASSHYWISASHIFYAFLTLTGKCNRQLQWTLSKEGDSNREIGENERERARERTCKFKSNLHGASVEMKSISFVRRLKGFKWFPIVAAVTVRLPVSLSVRPPGQVLTIPASVLLYCMYWLVPIWAS